MTNYITISRADAELEHAGVKGMKWGIRKAALPGRRPEMTKGERYSASIKARQAAYQKQIRKTRRATTMNVVTRTALQGAATLGVMAAAGYLSTPQGRKNVARGAQYVAGLGLSLTNKTGRAQMAQNISAFAKQAKARVVH